MSDLGGDKHLREMYEGKFFGKYLAKVVDNNDPKKRYRLKLQVDAIFNSDEGEKAVITDWAVPAMPIGMFFLPKKGEHVWVEFRQGDLDFPLWCNKYIDEKIGDNLPPNTHYPDNRIVHAPLGKYTMEFCEKAGEEYFKLTAFGNSLFHIKGKAGEEFILLQDKEGDLIKIDPVTKNITIVAKKDLQITTDESIVETIGKDKTETVTGKWTVTATGDAKLESSGKVDVKATGKATLEGTAGTDVGSGASVTNVKGSIVNLAGGGLPVARVGDQSVGIGNLGAPVMSNIIQGSTKVTSA